MVILQEIQVQRERETQRVKTRVRVEWCILWQSKPSPAGALNPWMPGQQRITELQVHQREG